MFNNSGSSHAAPIITMKNVVFEHSHPDYGIAHRTEIDRLQIDKGECAVVVGQVGSGKSTLMNALGCLKRPKSADTFEIADEIVSQLWSDLRLCDRFRSNVVGIARQHVELSPALTVRENIELPLSLAGRRDDKLVDELLRRLSNQSTQDLVRLQDRVVHKMFLSGGQRQSIGMARALVNQPLLLLADEPTSSLDMQTAKSMLDFLNMLRERNGMTIVTVTHQPELFDNMATQFVELTCPRPGLGVIDRSLSGSHHDVLLSRVHST